MTRGTSIVLRDHASDRDLGLFNGYGSGSGMALKLMGGGARKMTQDDIQENTKKFVELLEQHVHLRAARLRPLGIEEAGVTGGLAKAEQRLQDVDEHDLPAC